MPMDRSKYDHDWEQISRNIRFVRADGHCEGSPAYPNCKAQHGESHPITDSKVVLTVAHLDHDSRNNEPHNLRAMCQRCHLTYDAALHAKHAAETRRALMKEAGQMELL